jgi:cytochrome c
MAGLVRAGAGKATSMYQAPASCADVRCNLPSRSDETEIGTRRSGGHTRHPWGLDMRRSSSIALLVAIILPAGLVAPNAIDRAMAQAANPCAPQAAANPCAGKPEVDPKRVLRPKGTSLAAGNQARVMERGKSLFNDPKLSTNGMACMGCHTDNANFAPSFTTPYPHKMAMATQKSGVGPIHLDEAIQFCMMVPMQASPLPWNSRELSALTAYMGELQHSVGKQTTETGATSAKSANPCAPKSANPCAPKQ